ncbi:MAG: BrnA antitoxin family protein [Guyparkeria sp.]
MPKHSKTNDKRRIAMNTPEEDAKINAGIAADEDTFEPTDDQFQTMRKVGRPKAEATKSRITIRLSPDVVERFRASGPGWQTRMDAALKDWLKDHAPEQVD